MFLTDSLRPFYKENHALIALVKVAFDMKRSQLKGQLDQQLRKTLSKMLHVHFCIIWIGIVDHEEDEKWVHIKNL